MKLKIFILVFFLQISHVAFLQTFTVNDYQKANWLTTRMYGGQRSGDGPNWLIMGHEVKPEDQATLTQHKGFVSSKYQPGKCFTDDADGDYSLSGGWVDCGDHVKFGQTMFYAGYMLAFAYSEFPEGYDDYYTWDYPGYFNSGDFTWEGAEGIPNGIPDILDELKYQTDFFIKCARNPTTFYSQVGMGDPDHKNWITSVAMAALPKTEGGQADGARDIRKNPEDCTMPAMASATLAVMSRIYRKYDADYADLCLQHAMYAHQYAESKKGLTEGATGGSFYPAKSDWEDSYAIMLAELYRATGTEAFKTEALTYASLIRNHNWTLCYNNCDDIAAYLLGTFGNQVAKDLLAEIVEGYISDANALNEFTRGPSWGALRYTAAQAFAAALLSKQNNEEGINPYTLATIEYIMGKNSSNLSFIVGFGANHAQRPHHRNYYGSDDISVGQNELVVPEKNRQHGYLVGGATNPASYIDETEVYTSTEGGIDYNAGLVGALGYLVSKIAPVDINRFGHPAPDLGDDLTICGVSELTLTAQFDFTKLDADESVTFKWYKDAATTPFAEGANMLSVNVAEAGEYKCEAVESLGEWTTSDKVVVSATLPQIDLGADFDLCVPAFATLDANLTGEGVSYQWYKDNIEIENEQTSSLEIFNGGTYSVVVSATGCSDVSDEIIVGSRLLNVSGPSVVASGQSFSLSIQDEGGQYNWYDSPDLSTPIETGLMLTTSISSDKTFYAKDISSVNETFGRTDLGTQNIWTVQTFAETQNQYKVTVHTTVELSSISVFADNGGMANVTIKKDGTAIFSSESVQIPSGRVKTAIPIGFVLEPGEYVIDGSGSTASLIKLGDGTAQFPYTIDGVVEFTNNDAGWAAPNQVYGYFFDWQVSMGNPCDATIFKVSIDENIVSPQQSIELNQGWNLISFYVLPTDNSVNNIIAGIESNIDIIKTQEAFYMRGIAPHLNSLTHFEFGKAYLIYANLPTIIEIEGEYANTLSIDLLAGWNYFGYSKNIDGNTEDVFSENWNNEFEIIKDFDNFKDRNSGTLNYLEKGKGYFIKFNIDANISY